MDLAWNNQQRLLCHKTKPNQTKPNQTKPNQIKFRHLITQKYLI